MNESNPKEQKWISVEDALPKDKSTTWVFFDGNVEMDSFDADERGAKFVWTNGNESGEYISNGWYVYGEENITHWMPIIYPDPPKFN